MHLKVNLTITHKQDSQSLITSITDSSRFLGCLSHETSFQEE
jgi:hypothetical protein